MRNFLYIPFICISLCILSCSNNDENIHNGRTVSADVDAYLQKTKKILNGCSNGWLMKMYPSKTLEYGGYNIFLRFDEKNSVTAITELEPNEDNDQTYLSREGLYSLDNANGPSLVFDTYIEPLHIYSQPDTPIPYMNKNKSIGANGDFIFNILSVDHEKILLKGLRSGVLCELVPLPEKEDWNKLMNEIIDSGKKFDIQNFIIKNGNYEVKGTYMGGLERVLHLSDGLDIPIRYTFKGIETYEPINLNGNVIRKFDYLLDGDDYKFVSPDKKVEIIPQNVALNHALTNSQWGIAYSKLGPIGQKAFDIANNNISFITDETGFHNYSFTLAFLGKFTQDMGEGTGFGIWAMISDSESESGGDTFIRIPLNVSFDEEHPNEVSISFAPELAGPDSKKFLKLGLGVLAAPFTHVGKIMKDGENIYDDVLGERHFHLETDNPKHPKVITMIDKDDPTNRIVLNEGIGLSPMDV